MNETTVGSSGRLIVEPGKVYVEVDAGIVQLVRALIPPVHRLQPQRHPPHVTLVRNEPFVVGDIVLPASVNFSYDPQPEEGEVYWWINVWGEELHAVRVQLGLPPSSEWSRPPSGEEVFHITVGNKKNHR